MISYGVLFLLYQCCTSEESNRNITIFYNDNCFFL